MIYKADFEVQERLLQLPESGMGYQLITARYYPPGTVNVVSSNFVAYNSELIIPHDHIGTEKQKIQTYGYSEVLKSARSLDIFSSTINLISKNRFYTPKSLENRLITNMRRHQNSKGAVDNPEEEANGNEIFVRISAYKDDKRIDFVNRRLKDGSYTTTEQDYLICVKTNDDPIDRYALPNDETIKWSFVVKPRYGNTLQRGIVQAAFGHAGGGEEAYFFKGTSNDTYLTNREYGK